MSFLRGTIVDPKGKTAKVPFSLYQGFDRGFTRYKPGIRGKKTPGGGPGFA
jgi:hypothetical protein